MTAWIKWTPEMDALLGTMSDQVVADELEVPRSCVRYRRRTLGVSARYPKVPWTPEMEALLGTMFDWKVAHKLGIYKPSVRKRRIDLGIPAFRPHGPAIKWTPEMDMLLGTRSDQGVADELGIHCGSVRQRRDILGIPSWAEQNRVLPEKVSAYSNEASHFYGARRKSLKAEVLNTLTHEQWEFACEWFNDCCAYCGRDEPLGEDHRIPLSKGGPRTALNILPCCSSCNSNKHTSKAQDWIYQKFGREKGKEIVDRIVAYLTEVQVLWG